MQFDDSGEGSLFNEEIKKLKIDKKHYVVIYKRIEFDLGDFCLSKMRQVMIECEAAFTIEGRNDFYCFMADILEQLNEDEYWKNKHKLGSAESWLKLKEDI